MNEINLFARNDQTLDTMTEPKGNASKKHSFSAHEGSLTLFPFIS